MKELDVYLRFKNVSLKLLQVFLFKLMKRESVRLKMIILLPIRLHTGFGLFQKLIFLHLLHSLFGQLGHFIAKLNAVVYHVLE